MTYKEESEASNNIHFLANASEMDTPLTLFMNEEVYHDEEGGIYWSG